LVIYSSIAKISDYVRDYTKLNNYKKEKQSEDVQFLGDNQMYKIVICDDETIYIKEITDLLHSYGYENSCKFEIASYSNAQALLKCNFKNFDMFLLDINMEDNNGINGINIAEKIKNENSEAIVIFITGYNYYIDDIFRVKAFRYIDKPIDTNRFNSAIQYAIYEICNKPMHLIVNNYGNVFKIYANDILYVYVKNRKTILLTYEGTKEKYYECDDKIEKIVEQLGNQLFCKIYNKKYINIKYVIQYNEHEVILKKGDYELKLSISRRNLNDFKDCFYAYGGNLR